MKRPYAADLVGRPTRMQPQHVSCRGEDSRASLSDFSPLSLAEYATELLGLDIQSVMLARSRSRRSGGLQVWELMTPHGPFLLVEDGVVAEMFLVASAKVRRDPSSATGVMQAIARYRDLHRACERDGAGARDAVPPERNPPR
jgi:hypothetical protein